MVGGQRETNTCHYSMAVVPVLCPPERLLAVQSLLESILRSLLDHRL
jgi:hypothetical protein